jgi:hypothetical protein
MGIRQVFENFLIAFLAVFAVVGAVGLVKAWVRHPSGEPFLAFSPIWSPRQCFLFQMGLVASGLLGVVTWLWIAYSTHQDIRPFVESGLLAPHIVDKLVPAAGGTLCWLVALTPMRVWGSAALVNRVPPTPDYARMTFFGGSLLLWLEALTF